MKVSRHQEEWTVLWRGIDELVGEFGDRIVFIGGIAVYLHVINAGSPDRFVEFSHDGDFLISLEDFATLRDFEEVTANRRLKKHQLVKHGVEFDVYIERHHGLLVPYDAARAASIMLSSPAGLGVRVVCLEHLLVLKLDAYRARRGSAKGSKDERDLVRIAYIAGRTGGLRRDLVDPYLDVGLIDALVATGRSQAFMHMSQGNAHQAKILRDAFSHAFGGIVGSRKRAGR